MPHVTIRRAHRDDAESIHTLYRELVNNASVSVSSEHLADVARDERTALFVAEAGRNVVGTVLISLCLDVMFESQPFAIVENIIVASSHRQLGIGVLLMKAVESYCQKAHCSKIMLLSSTERLGAHRFFENLGYAGSKKKGFVKYRSAFVA